MNATHRHKANTESAVISVLLNLNHIYFLILRPKIAFMTGIKYEGCQRFPYSASSRLNSNYCCKPWTSLNKAGPSHQGRQRYSVWKHKAKWFHSHTHEICLALQHHRLFGTLSSLHTIQPHSLYVNPNCSLHGTSYYNLLCSWWSYLQMCAICISFHCPCMVFGKCVCKARCA